ncbi:sodium-coupled monocarboxylate transporter 1-like [Venturia canescens]|uniref:sodium-coupled monocarboxylate transporter 1-like n=1 Tax=Venturia canescens TaxID=32260 RepID=UPI001C9BC49C|nr:sodium-coupled monocarboxylate transporter 1-like [Venturia canescens]
MNSFPVAMSLLASHVSGVTLLGVPSEVYQYGSQYAACIFTATITSALTIYIFLPVFYKLQLPSIFEYLEIRFARPVRILSSLFYIVSLFIYIPIVVYVPAICFSQVTKFDVHALVPILCLVCIVYTSIGGLKAVVWTDTIQFSVTIGGLLAVLFLGIQSAGGISNVWRIAEEGERLVFFNMDPSPFLRNSFWMMTFGATANWVAHVGIGQGSVQRFLAVPTQRQAKLSMVITMAGQIMVKFVTVLTGLIIYAKYHDCDPLLTKVVKRSDQALPYYVMDVAGNIPGLPGLFLAGLVSAALSTMSASLNTVSGSIYEDFIEPWVAESEAKEAKAAKIMKVTVVVAGLIAGAMVYVVEHMGTVFRMAHSMRSVVDGPLLGLFILGMMVPWVRARGAMIGGCVSLVTMAWLVGRTQWYIAHGKLHHAPLPTSIDGCPYPLNETVLPTAIPSEPEDEPALVYQISFMYYFVIGSSVTVIVALVSSALLGEIDLSAIDPDHITPAVRIFLPKQIYDQVPMGETKNEITISDSKEKQER